MKLQKILLICVSFFFLEIIGSCVVSPCSPQLSLYDVAGAQPNLSSRYFDWIATPSGALVAVSTFDTGIVDDIGVNLYTFDGTTLTLTNTLHYSDEEEIQGVSFLNDAGNYYLAIAHIADGFFGAELDVYSVSLSGIPTFVATTNLGLGEAYIKWLPKLFIDGSGDRNYFLALVGIPRVSVAQFNVTQSSLSLTTVDSNIGLGLSVDWLISGANQYLAAGLFTSSSPAVPPSNIGQYEFSAFPISSSGPNDVGVEVSATSNGYVGWFTLGANNYLATAYNFSGGSWLKVSQFTAPSTFTPAPSCGVQLPSGATTQSTSNMLIGGSNYITVGMSGVSNSLQIYRYTESGGGSYCLAYEGNFGAVRDAKWITIGGNQYLGVLSDNQTGCFDNNFRILELNYTPDQPIINSPLNGALICDMSVVTVSGVAAGAACGQLQLSIDGGSYITVVSDLPESGIFSFNTPTLSDGVHTLTIKSVLLTSPVIESSTTSITITIDTQAPPAPVITSPVSPLYCGPGFYTIEGTSEPNSTIGVSDNGSGIVVTTADGAGNWSTGAYSFNAGTHLITATATDACFHTSGPSNTVQLILTDTVPVPVINNAGNCIYCGPQAFNITGTAQPTSDITIYNNGIVFDTTTADGSGNWSYMTPVLAVGNYSFTATATDDCARESDPSNALCIVITATVQPPIINNASECITCGPNPYTITGTNGVPNNTVTIFQDGFFSGQVTADNSGNWSYVTPSLPAGTYQFTANTTDNCSRTSALSNPLCIIISDVAQAPTINSLSGCQSSQAGQANVSGTGPVSSPIYVYVNDNLSATTSTDVLGIWSAMIDIPSTGIYFVSARAQDDCMRLSASSNVVCFQVGQISALVQAIAEKYCPFAR